MHNNVESIVLVGVGGQGILLASEIVAQAAMNEGFDVKTNDVHGMAQRGGSVLSQIRYGKKVYSPLVEIATAKVLCSLERIEALRFSEYLKKDGLAVINSQRIVPVTVSMGAAQYPKEAEKLLTQQFKRLIYFDAADKAEKLGNVKVANVVLLGAISKEIGFSDSAWEKAISDSVANKYVDINIQAFREGQKEGIGR